MGTTATVNKPRSIPLFYRTITLCVILREETPNSDNTLLRKQRTLQLEHHQPAEASLSLHESMKSISGRSSAGTESMLLHPKQRFQLHLTLQRRQDLGATALVIVTIVKSTIASPPFARGHSSPPRPIWPTTRVRSPLLLQRRLTRCPLRSGPRRNNRHRWRKP